MFASRAGARIVSALTWKQHAKRSTRRSGLGGRSLSRKQTVTVPRPESDERAIGTQWTTNGTANGTMWVQKESKKKTDQSRTLLSRLFISFNTNQVWGRFQKQVISGSLSFLPVAMVFLAPPPQSRFLIFWVFVCVRREAPPPRPPSSRFQVRFSPPL